MNKRVPIIDKFIFDHSLPTYHEAVGVPEKHMHEFYAEAMDMFVSYETKSGIVQHVYENYSKEEACLTFFTSDLLRIFMKQHGIELKPDSKNK